MSESKELTQEEMVKEWLGKYKELATILRVMKISEIT